MKEPLRFLGVMPANVLPFTSDLAIDEPAYRRHLRWLADTRGVTGIVANGHASEVSSLNREERRRSLAIALDEVGDACPVIAGVYSDGTQDAVDLARDARAAGAAGVLVFPPTLFMWGAQLKPDMVLRHFSEIASRADLPIVVFEYPPASGIGYSPETLARLAEIPQVAAVKDWSNEIVAFEANLRALHATGRPVAMLSAFTMSLMGASCSAPTARSRAWAASRPTCKRSCSRHAARAISTVPDGSTTGWPRSCPCSTRRRSWTCTTG